MVSIDQLEKGIGSYLDKELMPLFDKESTIQKIIIGTGISLAIRKGRAQIPMLMERPFVKMVGIFDETGNIDIDTLKEEVIKQIPEKGFKVEVPVIGELTFHKADVEKLYEHITNSSSLH